MSTPKDPMSPEDRERVRQVGERYRDAVEAATTSREDVAPTEVRVRISEADGNNMVAAYVSALSDAGLKLDTFDTNWFPVMVRTEVANKLLKTYLEHVRVGDGDPLRPSHLVMLAIENLVGNIKRGDPEFLKAIENLRTMVAKDAPFWAPAQERVPKVIVPPRPTKKVVGPRTFVENNPGISPVVRGKRRR